MATPTALFDANVLASMTLTDLVIEFAYHGLFAARWSDDIHQEWIKAVLKRKPHLAPDKLDKRRQAMDRHAPDALVVGYEPLIATLTLPDPDDRHVLAAAIHGQCNVLVTFDLKDFPPSALTSHGIVAVHPDAFLLDIATDHEVQFLASVKACRARLLNPTQSPDQHLAQMIKVGLPMLAAKLGAFKAAF